MTMTTTPQWTFADRLAKARKEAGLTPDELAEKAGQHPNTVRAWERGENRPRDPVMVAQIYEESTGVAAEWILLGDVRTARFLTDFDLDELGIDIAA